MSKSFELTAELREDKGKGASRRLRLTDKVPAVLYGGRDEARALSLDHGQLLHKLENESFYSSILTIKVGDVEQQAILKDLQRHPAKRRLLHADFQRVLADEKITLSVPLHFLGEEDAPGVKAGGIISKMQTEISISCLPGDLPEYLEIDMSELELDKMMYLSEIVTSDKVEITDLSHDRNEPVVAIHRPMKEEELEPVEGEEAAEGEVPTIDETEAKDTDTPEGES
ncbi:MAG: 50S ribosomal protein L25/general stress protein Ctc [Gammaproteobacteria bacterium]|nr:50S ribosomal protein L25/general stress protein Ctc [Gammaproteobacteria bacterium]NNF60792.1 50S ribosomal protein L25/general stress protein Ctc [Gammaproteobacteria bacterium]